MMNDMPMMGGNDGESGIAEERHSEKITQLAKKHRATFGQRAPLAFAAHKRCCAAALCGQRWHPVPDLHTPALSGKRARQICTPAASARCRQQRRPGRGVVHGSASTSSAWVTVKASRFGPITAMPP